MCQTCQNTIYFNVHRISSLQKIISIVGFADMLCSADRRLFLQMLNDCHRYSNAINAKGEPFPAEALLMTLVFIQHKMISWLIKYQHKKLK
jgi:hypothetical protein